jgi:hypothetical protein
MRQTAAEFVLHLQNDSQKQNQLPVCKDMYDNTKDRNFLSKVITGDKTGFMKVQVKGQRFKGTMEIQAKSQVVLEIIMTSKF